MTPAPRQPQAPPLPKAASASLGPRPRSDAGSRRDTQDHYLETASRLGFRKIVDGFRAILLKTDAHQKYHHLASALARLGYLTTPEDLRQFACSWMYKSNPADTAAAPTIQA